MVLRTLVNMARPPVLPNLQTTSDVLLSQSIQIRSNQHPKQIIPASVCHTPIRVASVLLMTSLRVTRHVQRPNGPLYIYLSQSKKMLYRHHSSARLNMTPTKEISEGNNVAQVAQKRAMCNLGELRSRILHLGVQARSIQARSIRPPLTTSLELQYTIAKALQLCLQAMAPLREVSNSSVDLGSFRSLANADLLLQIHLRWQPISCYSKDFDQLLLLATQQTLAHRTTCM